MEDLKGDVEDNKSNGETEPKAPTSKLIIQNETAATDAKPLKVFILIFFIFLTRSFEKGICEYLNT